MAPLDLSCFPHQHPLHRLAFGQAVFHKAFRRFRQRFRLAAKELSRDFDLVLAVGWFSNVDNLEVWFLWGICHAEPGNLVEEDRAFITKILYFDCPRALCGFTEASLGVHMFVSQFGAYCFAKVPVKLQF